MKPAGPPVNTYRMSPLRRSLIWWILSPILLSALAIAVFGKEDGRGAGILLFLMSAPWLIWWHWYTGRLRLEISPQGVTHRHGKLVMQAPWNEVERVRIDRGREGLILQSPMTGSAVERLASVRGFMVSGQPVYDAEQQQCMAEHGVIPLDIFAYLLKNGKLLRDLDEFAPALGQETRSALEHQTVQKRLPKLPASPEQQRRNAYLFLIIAAALGLGLYNAFHPGSVSDRVAEAIFTVACAIAMPCLVFTSAWSSRNAFRAGSKTLGVIFAISALVFSFGALLYLGKVADLFGGRTDRTPARSAFLSPHTKEIPYLPQSSASFARSGGSLEGHDASWANIASISPGMAMNRAREGVMPAPL